MQLARRLQLTDADLRLRQDRARVHSICQANDGVPGVLFSLHDRPVDRRSAAIFWKARGMEVDAAESWMIHDRRRDFLAERNDNHQIRRRQRLGVNVCGFEDRKRVLRSELGDGSGC